MKLVKIQSYWGGGNLSYWSRVSFQSNMTNVIIKGNLNADVHTGSTHVKMKTEIRVMVL